MSFFWMLLGTRPKEPCVNTGTDELPDSWENAIEMGDEATVVASSPRSGMGI